MISHINWDITQKCNLNCSYCGAHGKYEDLPTAMMIKIAKNIANSGVKSVTIAGGEPFFRKDIFKILQILKDYDLKVIILTNGTLINDEAVKKLVKYSIDGVRVSLDFASASKYDMFRGTFGLFARVNYAINQLVAHDIYTGINGTIFQENIKEISNILDYAIEHKCKLVRFMPIAYIGRARHMPYGLDIYSQTLRETIIQVARRKESFEKIGFSSIPKGIEDFARNYVVPCPAGIHALNITSEGSVKLCPLLPQLGEDLSATALKDSTSILDKMLHEVFQADALEGKCKECELKYSCKGGCPVHKVSKGLSFSAEQPTCIINLIEEALSDIWEEPGVREILGEASLSMSLSPNFCFRALPLWVHIIKNTE